MKKNIAIFLSTFLKFFYKLRFGKKIVFGKKTILNHKFKFKGPGKLIIGDNVNLWAYKEPNEFFTYDQKALITIGDDSRLNGISIHCKESVTIGKNCLAGSCIIIDNDFHSIHFEKRNNSDFIKSKPVIIKNKVWLAGQSAILKGVTIEEESVVGFRAVVTRNVEAKTVVAGNPAQVVKRIE